MVETFSHTPVLLDYELICENASTGRTYLTPKGKRYPSITSVLSALSKDKIQEWRSRVGVEEASRVSRVAASRGTSVHSLVEDFLNGKPVDLKKAMPNTLSAFNSIKPILKTRIGNILIQEAGLYSDHLGVAGRVDIVAEFDNKLSIVDIKTSTRIKDKDEVHNYFMQETAYAIMFEERTGIPITSIVTIIAVDFAPPIVFKEHRDNWTKPLLEAIKTHRHANINPTCIY